jgi:hypothetical protein
MHRQEFLGINISFDRFSLLMLNQEKKISWSESTIRSMRRLIEIIFLILGDKFIFRLKEHIWSDKELAELLFDNDIS